MVQILNDMPAAQQLEMCGLLSKCMTPKGQLTLPMSNGTNVFQVEEEDEVLMNIEHVFIGGIQDQEHIIIDTGSSHNLIGRHLLPLLTQRLKNAGISTEPLPA